VLLVLISALKLLVGWQGHLSR